DAIMSVKKENSYCIYLSPAGNLLTQKKVASLAKEHEHLILVCGHYEGIDERVIELAIDEEISIGDYVLTGGEIAAQVLTDAVSRYVEGVLGEEESTSEESFSNGLLEYPQYTRPQSFKGLEVPEVLISGHHAKIQEWREEKSLEKTKKVRPDLLKSR
ncbi:MAG: tRNA (guanosine(37)-N1)-methyltransferase TrmD, partial [Clostridia bacterium]|nr:tRNA (guanosine(37)-N1)-methyltransferase TrmD [Clostridia bacterium]